MANGGNSSAATLIPQSSAVVLPELKPNYRTALLESVF
jgi:hypothetical protein